MSISKRDTDSTAHNSELRIRSSLEKLDRGKKVVPSEKAAPLVPHISRPTPPLASKRPTIAIKLRLRIDPCPPHLPLLLRFAIREDEYA